MKWYQVLLFSGGSSALLYFLFPVCTTKHGVETNLPSIPQCWSARVFRNRLVTVSQVWRRSCRTLAAAERSGTVADSSCARYRCIYSFPRRLCHTVKVWNVPESPAGTQTNKTFISVNPSLLSLCSASFVLRVHASVCKLMIDILLTWLLCINFLMIYLMLHIFWYYFTMKLCFVVFFCSRSLWRRAASC